MARKRAIPNSIRRELAARHGCEPGMTVATSCHYCGVGGSIRWYLRRNGDPSAWVAFSGLEMDHVIPESLGGPTKAENIVLACASCNRSKGTRIVQMGAVRA